MERKITVDAYAKINLAVDVLGKRDDGYHQVEMVMQSVSLKDTITVAEGNTLALSCNSEEVPLGEENLVIKAARLLQESCGCSRGASIHIEKNIPVAAGLAGGSADAAAAMVALNQLWQLRLPLGKLAYLGGLLGSDIPFCLIGGTCLASGRGERVTILPPVPSLFLLLVNPGFPVPTAEVYRNFRAAEVPARPDVRRMVAAIEGGSREELLACMGNSLEYSTFKLYPEVRELKEKLHKYNVDKVVMCGSGPTVFAVVDSFATARQLAAQLRREYPFAAAAKTV